MDELYAASYTAGRVYNYKCASRTLINSYVTLCAY